MPLEATQLFPSILCRIVPPAVIRGIQLAVGLQLAEKGLALVWFNGATRRPIIGVDSLWVGLAAAAFTLVALFAGVRLASGCTAAPQGLDQLLLGFTHFSVHQGLLHLLSVLQSLKTN